MVFGAFQFADWPHHAVLFFHQFGETFAGFAELERDWVLQSDFRAGFEDEEHSGKLAGWCFFGLARSVGFGPKGSRTHQPGHTATNRVDHDRGLWHLEFLTHLLHPGKAVLWSNFGVPDLADDAAAGEGFRSWFGLLSDQQSGEQEQSDEGLEACAKHGSGLPGMIGAVCPKLEGSRLE